MVNSNLEKFLPALLSILGRVASTAGKVGAGGDEEEEKSMEKSMEKGLFDMFRSKPKKEEPSKFSPFTPENIKRLREIQERYKSDKAKELPKMNKQQIEKSILKMQTDLDSLSQLYKQAPPLPTAGGAAGGGVKTKTPLPTAGGAGAPTPGAGAPTPGAGAPTPGAGAPPGAAAAPPGGKVKTQAPTQVPIQAGVEEDDPYMGQLEERLAAKTRNKPTHGVRMRKPTVDDYRRNREGPPEGRKVTQQGATPSVSLMQLNKMLKNGFISKKADPAIAGQARQAVRSRSAETQANIRRGAESGAQAVGGPSDNTAQQIGSEIAGGTSWAAQQAWGETHGERPQAQPGTAAWNQQQAEDATSKEDLQIAVNRLGESKRINDAAPSGLVGPTGQPISSQTAPKTDSSKLNLPETGMYNPNQKAGSVNKPDLTPFKSFK